MGEAGSRLHDLRGIDPYKAHSLSGGVNAYVQRVAIYYFQHGGFSKSDLNLVIGRFSWRCSRARTAFERHQS
jgi:hypothetical protein